MLVILAAGRRLGPKASSIVVFATSPAPVGEQGAEEVSIAADIDEIEWHDAHCGHTPLPCSVREKLTLADCYKALTRQLGVWALWQNAATIVGARDAIEVCIEELVASGVDGTQRSHYRFGEHFLESVRNWGFGARPDHASVLIESCARIILGIPKNPLNEFRESSNSAEQRTRDDGACAFRTHLTKKGAGFRLMLWRLMDGTIEFANVGDKDELAIM